MKAKLPKISDRRFTKGFTLIEVVLAIALILILEIAFYPSYKLWQQQSKIMKLNSACHYLRLELSAMQTRSFYIKDKYLQSLKIHSDGQGYDLYINQGKTKTVMLSKVGWGCLKLFCINKIQFLPGGVPKAYAKIIVQLRDDDKVKKIVEVQPVTGRIVIKDE
ncbi:MAG: prepilin-type N-terminal cleavage/methylation domain-containing protein [Acidaminococcaceae bacterium]